MDPTGPIARRFPLIARHRPACRPLPERVTALTELADSAAKEANSGRASAVFNQAALLASDLGLPEIAAAMCHQHAAAYLLACPLPATSAIRALEPVVNLARLRIRSGHADEGRHRLTALYDAVRTTTSTQFDDVMIPAHLTATPADRNEVHAWLWRVLLADGTRTLTTQGRWNEALAHLATHHGIGNRMLDGRQVAVLTALVEGDSTRAEHLLSATESGEAWERTVTACLSALHRREVGDLTCQVQFDLAENCVTLASGPGTTVFRTRLALTALDLVHDNRHAARQITEHLYLCASEPGDGYAAREALAHPGFREHATAEQQQECRGVVDACALEAGETPAPLLDRLSGALVTSEYVIRQTEGGR
ncbi:hypothetical protein ABII15_35860 [Streptomyces sp. HUAS MG91]|uniref:Uncharacterized protein n=1 Tax=Streptomyces tabacisoli TaxID=3156398 RepID=A0AAU8J463_9ACTN